MALTIWHNPRCSKSRQALAFFQENGQVITERRYLDTPPTRAELAEVARLLGLAPRDMIRSKEDAFREKGLSLDDAPDRLLDAMADTPRLIERPIVIDHATERAAICRRPEALQAML